MEMREYKITANAFECGVLFGLIMQADEKQRVSLVNVWKQLVTLKKQAEEEAGVTKEMLPGGQLKLTDKDGTVIIRDPFPYEVEGN
ncbi:hypothetical protein ES703_00672 [subsurface metagenome]